MGNHTTLNKKREGSEWEGKTLGEEKITASRGGEWITVTLHDKGEGRGFQRE